MTITSSSLLDAAVAAARRGFHIFPLRPDTKVPAVKDWENRATCDQARIQQCWSAGAWNIGVACGPSGLVVVDLDTPKPGQEPPPRWEGTSVTCGADVLAALARHAGIDIPTDTFTVTTPRGGTHLYFQAPERPRLRSTAGTVGWLIDTRACGGYVVGPGSTVAGRAYTVTNDGSPVPLFPCLAALLTPPAEHSEQPARPHFQAALSTKTRRDRYVAAAVRNETARVRTAPVGRRNQLLYIAALRLGELVGADLLDTTTITHTLTDAGTTGSRGSIRECAATIASGLKAGARTPRKAPA